MEAGERTSLRPLKQEVLSRRQLEMFVQCPRCFWLLKCHGIKQPEGFPLAIQTIIDSLLKAEFDEYRKKGKPHPILTEYGVHARLFPDLEKLSQWRNNRQGLRWTDPQTKQTLFGAVDDVLEFPDGALAVLDYKASGAAEATVYPSYQLQLDTYTFLLGQMGYTTAPRAFLAFFQAVREDGFQGRLPFRGKLVEVVPQPERVGPLFSEALEVAHSQEMPPPGEECKICRWYGEVKEIL